MDKIRLKDGFRNEYLFVMQKEFMDQVRNNGVFDSLRVTDIGYFPHALHHYRERPTGCDAYILMYCSDGEGFCQIGEGDSFILHKGQVVILPPHIPHIYSADDISPWSVYWIHLQGCLIDSFYSWVDVEMPMDLNVIGCGELETLFQQSFKLLRNNCRLKDYFYLCQLVGHMLGVIQYTQSDHLITLQAEKAVQTAVVLMRQNIHGSLTLAQLSEATSFSSSYLVQLFRRMEQCAPIEYFLKMKLQEASKDLYFTQRSVKEIALDYGFQDQFYFSRMFKKNMGVSPKQYRNQLRG